MLDNLIVIPFRSREPHLEIFMRDALPLFRKYLTPFKVVVVEQEAGKLFNRGQLINIGVNEYKEHAKYVFTHDVDICPSDNCVRDIYNKIPDTDIMGIYTSHWNTLGGIVKMEVKTFIDINGFPNNFWGWGIEDRAFQNRAETYNKTISKNLLSNEPRRFDFFSIKDDIKDDIRNVNFNARTKFEYEIFKNIDINDKKRYIATSGMNTLQYSIHDRRHIANDVELIKVGFKEDG